jgi:hypothetical protein
MKHLNLNPYTGLLVLVVLFSACSGPSENTGTSNTNAQPQEANSNSAPQPQIAQGNSPAVAASPAPLSVETIPPPPAPAEKSPANSNANNAPTTSNGRAPKLVAPEKKIDYGKQPQDKSLVRAIVIKNGGLANLNIESVVPS